MKKYENDFIPLGKVINDQIGNIGLRMKFNEKNNLTKKAMNDNVKKINNDIDKLSVIANDNFPENYQIKSYLKDNVIKGDCYDLLEGLEAN